MSTVCVCVCRSVREEELRFRRYNDEMVLGRNNDGGGVFFSIRLQGKRERMESESGEGN